ncbi:MAG: DUF1186 domain-containing protein [Deltaproteobacteria bacterium]|nr:DUF1186 domain-containing protein [Deltaproteobacteria bacterium]
MNYHNLTDAELVDLIFQEGDRLETDYLDEIKRRRESVLPLLIRIAREEKYYRMEGSKVFAVVHAVYLLGILGDPRSMEAFLDATQLADEYDIDWLWDALPECYLRVGPAAIPALKSFIEEDRENDQVTVLNEITGLWNLWTAYPETKKEIEDFFLEIINSPGENYQLRTELIADFALIKRRDLRPLFEEYYEKGEVDLDTLTRDDLDEFFDEPEEDQPVGFRFDLEAFYDPREVAQRQARWKAEAEKEQLREVEEFILENFSKIGRNDLCPCDSGLKFKKCHLKWAEEELRKIRIEEILDDENENLGTCIRDERHYETLLRRFLASKGRAALFGMIKEKTLEAINQPYEKDQRPASALTYLDSCLSQIEFANQEELKEFMTHYQEYHNALAGQYLGHPRDRQKLH